MVSSYTPTILALQAARAAPAGPDRPDGTLIVAVPSAPGQTVLPRAEAEAKTVAARIDGRIRTLTGLEATKAAVLEGLAAHSRVHFACHATPDPVHPSASRLELHDGTLAVHDLLRVRGTGGRLAFLSACGTAFGGHRLPDETIHMASAVQLAGYADVVASLWDVEDAVARSVAELWYEAYREHSPAVALHLTTSELRRRYPGNPLLWAAYLHLGPDMR